jgi:prolyl 4-hydroxylase
MTSLPPAQAAAASLARGDVRSAIAMAERGAAGDDAASVSLLALWRLVGQPLPRDLPEARALFRRARELGDLDAALTEAALTANGTGAAPDWAGALLLLRVAALRAPEAAAQLALLDAMRLSPEGAPTVAPQAEALVPGGAVTRFPGLLSVGECAHVAQAAADLLAPTVVVDPRTGRQTPHPVRTSDGAVIGPTRETLVVQAINRRIAAASATDWRQGEALTVLRYAPGQQYRAHFDTLPGTGNQRVKTMLVYLNEGFEGGETTFPQYGLVIRPRAGDAVLFDNTLPDGSVDRRSLHTGEPVRRGVKWLATRWIRTRPFSPWTGPEIAV